MGKIDKYLNKIFFSWTTDPYALYMAWSMGKKIQICSQMDFL